MFQRFISSQLDRVKTCPQAEMLGDMVLEKLEEALRRKVELVTGSTATRMISQAADNSLALALPGLLTEAERRRALGVVKQRLESGAMSLPEPLVECLELQLGYMTSAFLEALDRLMENRDAICDALLEGKRFRTIVDIVPSAGDTHNCGRSVTVFHTDAGKLVYKPHDLRADGQLYEFTERFFGDFVGIPRSVAFGKDFGVCEFIEKQRAEGAEEAERFWFSLGGLTVFAKLLGSTDLHYQNVLCSGTKPYIIDLETLLTPISSGLMEYMRSAETRKCQTRSPVRSLLMPLKVDDIELSVLANTEESGIAPVVDGKTVTMRSYLPAFKEGYRTAYARVVAQRKEIRQAVTSFPADMTVRVVLRPTKGYCEILNRLYHHSSMASEDGRQKSLVALEEILRKSDATAESPTIDSEVEQMRRGDVPYFYTYADSLDLYVDGKELVRGKFGASAIGHILDTLDAMGEEDEAFDLVFIDNAISRYPQEEGQEAGSSPRPEVADVPLAVEAAAAAAKRIFDQMHDMGIQAPNGRLVWGHVTAQNQSFSLIGPGLFDGFTGLTVFASACVAVWPESRIRERTDALIQETAEELQGLCKTIERHESNLHDAVSVGEGTGLGGILTGIALIRRYSPNKTLDTLCERLLALIERADYSGCIVADRIAGLAGLVSALCRFEEYRGCTTAIRAMADRLLELKTFAYRDHVLWKTMPWVPRALSGAGHGMSGIAEALVSAADVLADERYLSAADEALDYELDAYLRYADRFGTWADLRDFPPEKYMHGYCAGAPGTGIMLKRIMDRGEGGEKAQILASRAKESVDALPLNLSDYLCCGNAAIAEYRLSVGDLDAAGKILGAMHERGRREDGRRGSSPNANGDADATLFNGICGIGYEMLRYAFPQRILSIL